MPATSVVFCLCFTAFGNFYSFLDSKGLVEGSRTLSVERLEELQGFSLLDENA